MNRIVTRFCGAWLTAFGIAAWSSVDAAEPPALTCAAVAKPWLEDGSIVGAVVLATDREQTLLHEALGLADLASARPMLGDSLFWIASMTKPMTAAQVAWLATSYRHGEAGTPEPVPIGQLAYPLDGPGRFPMPGGGLFSTADDCGRFCRMLLGGGMSGGVRILSADAVRQMRTRQTPESVKEAYGLGVQIRPDGQYGHGGAFATDLLIDEGRGVALVWLVQDADPKKPSQACRDAVVAWLDGQPLNAR